MKLLVLLAIAGTITAACPAQARKAHKVNLAPVPVSGAMIDDRYPELRLPEAYGTARAQRPQKHSSHRYRRAYAQRRPVVRQTRVAATKERPKAKSLTGVVPALAAKAREIVGACGSIVISGVRHTYIAGTGGRLSLHASGRAVDIKGNPSCIMAHLRGWPGGASTDYTAVNHTHISYAPHGPEWGARFAHYRGGHRGRHHRRHRVRA